MTPSSGYYDAFIRRPSGILAHFVPAASLKYMVTSVPVSKKPSVIQMTGLGPVGSRKSSGGARSYSFPVAVVARGDVKDRRVGGVNKVHFILEYGAVVPRHRIDSHL